MKKLQASNDKNAFAIVDNDIAEIIKDMNLKFSIDKRDNKGYWLATKWIKLPGMTEKKRLYLHQFVYIIKTKTEPTSSIDHKDINPANNQFLNLRLATRQQQNRHRSKHKSNTSGYIGVCRNHQVNKHYKNGYRDYWRASIRSSSGHREAKLFDYDDEGLLEAARWRDKKAREYFGEFAVTNFPDENQ